MKEENVYEIILPRDVLKMLKRNEIPVDDYMKYVSGGLVTHVPMDNKDRAIWDGFARTIARSLQVYESLLMAGVPRESARYVLPFCQAVGIYHFTMNLRSLINFLGLRLCVRASPEMRALAAQFFFELVEKLPALTYLIGCRGFNMKACPEDNVTGVRKGKQLPNYAACVFRNAETAVFIPTRLQVEQGKAGSSAFEMHDAWMLMRAQYMKWAIWDGAT